MDPRATEKANDRTADIDLRSTLEILRIMNEEDKRVAERVGEELPAIARAVDLITDKLRGGGRLLYFGAGTSGRLGVLDASECPPTFGIGPETVTGVIAGGDIALREAAEGAEDDTGQGAEDAARLGVCGRDAVVGIAASGSTPYVAGAMGYARDRHAAVICLCNTEDPPLAGLADVVIAPVTGPEVIAGSTRLKAGTAQKMVLNMLSTASMIRFGRVYGNRMAGLRATNDKLRKRAAGIVAWAAGVPEEQARGALVRCGWDAGAAIVSIAAGCSPGEAAERLRQAGGNVRAAADPDNREMMEK